MLGAYFLRPLTKTTLRVPLCRAHLSCATLSGKFLIPKYHLLCIIICIILFTERR